MGIAGHAGFQASAISLQKASLGRLTPLNLEDAGAEGLGQHTRPHETKDDTKYQLFLSVLAPAAPQSNRSLAAASITDSPDIV